MIEIPTLEADPKTREELMHWLERRQQLYPGVPLSAREFLMVANLKRARPAYSVM